MEKYTGSEYCTKPSCMAQTWMCFNILMKFERQLKRIIIKNGLLLLIVALASVSSCKVGKDAPVLSTTIRVNESNNQAVKLSDIFDSISYVPLETNEESILPSFGRIINVDGYFFIRGHNKVLYIFKDNGDFLTKIDNIGKGPNEMLNPSTLKIINHQIFWLDVGTNQMFIYDFEGNFQYKFKTLGGESFEIVSENILLFYNHLYPYNDIQLLGKGSSNLVAIDKDYNVINKSFTYKERPDYLSSITGTALFKDADGEISFIPNYSSDIYNINKNLEITKKYSVEFNRNAGDEVFNKFSDYNKLRYYLKSNKYPFFIQSYLETKSLVYFIFLYTKSYQTVIQTKKNGEVFNVREKEFVNDLNGMSFGRICGTFDHGLLGSIQALEFKNYTKTQIENSSIIHPNSDITTIERSLKKMDNPIIALYYAKK